MEEHGGIILPTPGEVTQADIDRAAAAVANAPTTEAGIVIPPHVAKELAVDEFRGEQPNRAERRRAERAIRAVSKRTSNKRKRKGRK